MTGGAGYVGSHVLKHLGGGEVTPIIADDLSTGHSDAVLWGQLAVGDCRDAAFLDRVFSEHRFDAVFHLAGKVVATESVSAPLLYYGHNAEATLRLLEAMERHSVERLIFSSTAAVYGNSAGTRVDEAAPPDPINPYGASKMMAERMITDYAAASNLRYVILRYFNVAGADPDGRLGQRTEGATHLIKVACEAATGARDGVTIFGTDYPTADGTCIRDFVHVEDVASAHELALRYLINGGDSHTLNCGYGSGHSVRDVVDSVRRVSGADFPVTEGQRRSGDAIELVADSAAIQRVLGWTPSRHELDTIIRDSLAWERESARRCAETR